MNEIAILKRQIDALKELLDMKEQVIKGLKEDNQRLQQQVFMNPHQGVCSHTYPSPWYGTTTPNCTKCGQQQQPLYGWTSSGGGTV